MCRPCRAHTQICHTQIAEHNTWKTSTQMSMQQHINASTAAQHRQSRTCPAHHTLSPGTDLAAQAYILKPHMKPCCFGAAAVTSPASSSEPPAAAAAVAAATQPSGTQATCENRSTLQRGRASTPGYIVLAPLLTLHSQATLCTQCKLPLIERNIAAALLSWCNAAGDGGSARLAQSSCPCCCTVVCLHMNQRAVLLWITPWISPAVSV